MNFKGLGSFMEIFSQSKLILKSIKLFLGNILKEWDANIKERKL